mmetsp:Transcript_2916/g.6115  ORF Transcript_2916/g.6115 Transcript_2916/m.6115 type:complete len:81 (-) Transcript_2916:584-826(-)
MKSDKTDFAETEGCRLSDDIATLANKNGTCIAGISASLIPIEISCPCEPNPDPEALSVHDWPTIRSATQLGKLASTQMPP